MKSFPILLFVISTLELSVLSETNSSFVADDSHIRIVGGRTISIEKAPWTVLLILQNLPICGGSIISVNKILSAAHCTIGWDRRNFIIRAGSSKSYIGGQIRRISQIIEHPQYTHDTNTNDLSILFLRTPLVLSTFVKVIAVDNKDSQLIEGKNVLATGWGRLCEKCAVSKTLREVKLPVVGNDRCRKIYKSYNKKFKILPSMLCCGRKSGGKDTCQGDSGGPVVFNNRLVGIVSFGIGCARPNLPGVYTRVSYFATWIKSYL